MIAFKKLVFVMETPRYHSHCRPNECEFVPATSLATRLQSYEIFEGGDLLGLWQEKFETRLGPSIRGDTSGIVNCGYSECLQFLPRGFEAKRLKPESERLEASLTSVP